MRKYSTRGRVREKKETLLHRATFLQDSDRALIFAYLDLGMSPDDLAHLHRVSAKVIRRRIERLTRMLADPCFVLAMQYSEKLPTPLAALARGYWMHGRTLRELAALHSQTLHAIRRHLILARSMLLLELASQQSVPTALAHATLSA